MWPCPCVCPYPSGCENGIPCSSQDALTACPTRECPVNSRLTPLAQVVDPSQGVFTPNRAVRRDVLFDSVTVGRDRCVLDGLAGVRGKVFYTNAKCTELRSGPGRDAVRQVLKPGWTGFLGGKYGSVESWYGMYQQVAENDEDGGFENIEQSLSDFN